MLSQLSLDGKNIVVTGAGTGLGKEMALAIAQAGGNLILAARRMDRIEEVAKCARAAGVKAVAFSADLTNTNQVVNLFKNALEEFEYLDVLINNAGIVRGQASLPIWEISDTDWNIGIETNLSTAFYCSRAIAKHMVDRKQGKIINVSSGFGLRGGRDNYMYSAAKGAILQLTRTLAISLGRHGVTSTCIVPGFIPTEGTSTLKETQPKNEFIPVGRVGKPHEIGPVAVFLASDASNYMNGEIFPIDGGGLAGGYAPTGYAPKIELRP
jgi:NAD(P)-dependent dehydrogenase (short-subunit alcohol dehydrogenase family)